MSRKTKRSKSRSNSRDTTPPLSDFDPVIRYAKWGSGFESGALAQMEHATRLPVAVAAALMPDAHQGYGLPIGGVLATRDAVIPYAVGMDIACRMRLGVTPLPPSIFETGMDRLKDALLSGTQFGVGAAFHKQRRDHPVMDTDWDVSPVTRAGKDKAWSQLGTSGSGNHFAEFGLLTLPEDDLGLEAGTYVALLTHGGSRGIGGDVATHYSRLAMRMHPELPREMRELAWLSLDSREGREYWDAMELMGAYAAANHALIHQHVFAALGVEPVLSMENHHNFAWKERHKGREVVVHRKGATPAHAGVLGIVPGSMATPGYVVRGKGCAESLFSCSHGAGRAMSRTEAKRRYRWEEMNAFLRARGVTLLGAGLDEAPMAYKDIEGVMDAQRDLVDRVARFDPRLVRMARG